MKTLKRLTVGELSQFCQLTEMEMKALVGGTGCCWEAMSCAYSDLYRQQLDPSCFKGQWEKWLAEARRQGCADADLGEYGDPTMKQTGYLLGFMQQYFSTSPSWVMRSVPIGNDASYGFAIMKGNSKDEEHAVIVVGDGYDSLGEKYYRVKDSVNGDTYQVRESEIIGGLCIGEK